MKPSEFIERLQTIAQDARYHPEPAVAVSLLAQLLLDMSLQVQAATEKFKPLLRQFGLPDQVEDIITYVETELAKLNSGSVIYPGSPAEPVPLDAGTVQAVAALVDPALASATEFKAEVLPSTPAP